jgi:hypothetical protein
MKTYEQILIMQAPADRPLHVWFEPWAEGLAFRVGSKIELRACSPIPGELEIEESAERTAIYAWPGSTLRAFMNDAEVLSFDLPVPDGLTRDKVAMLFGDAPKPSEGELKQFARKSWWKFWQ